ncbi:MAG TPA: heparan-alpha-glucosaminide N-acetyltransferase domain-containing protein [Vicinamibacterales bacterium]
MTTTVPARGVSPRVESPRSRVESIDVLRGLVMILMALDHVRDFVGDPNVSPTNLAQASAGLFMTRWITHSCAPVFFLLTGAGAYLSRGRAPASTLSRFLVTRGLWLIVLDAVVLRCLAWQFNFDFRLVLLNVLWALGWAMIVLAALVRLPTTAIAAFGLVLIAGHNLFDGVRSAHPIWTFLHSPNFLFQSPDHVIFVAYPIVPWIGVTAAGYALGQIYEWPADRRRAWLFRAGAIAAIAFVALRTLNVYGDPVPWQLHRSPLFTFLSFLNATKYPPSLLFLLMTLGPALLALELLDRRTPPWLAPALTIGKVPLFYFALHAALIHVVAIAICYARYGEVHWMFESPNVGAFPVTFPPGWGVSLPAIYAIWIAVVAALYPACRWFAGVKARRRDWWLRYL